MEKIKEKTQETKKKTREEAIIDFHRKNMKGRRTYIKGIGMVYKDDETKEDFLKYEKGRK